MGGGPPPILTERGWLTLWHGVEPKEIVGIYRTYWSLLDPDDPSHVLHSDHRPLIEANPDLTRPLEDRMRSEEHTSELQSLMRISYAVFCLKKKKEHNTNQH